MSMTTKQNKGLKRDTIDKYYTKLDIVEDCKIQIEKYAAILPTSIDLIEKIGGGSARCMMAEIFLDKK